MAFQINAAARIRVVASDDLEAEAQKIVQWLTVATRRGAKSKPRAGGGTYTHVAVPNMLEIDVSVENGKITLDGEHLPTMDTWRARGIKASQIIPAFKRQIKKTLDGLNDEDGMGDEDREILNKLLKGG